LRFVCLREAGSPAATQAEMGFLSHLNNMANREAFESNEDSVKPFEPMVNW
jgi:hypothetical protein